jgi:filamentous hemagglutinin
LNTDARFPVADGWIKMGMTHTLPDGKSISIHYQYNANTGKAYDVKLDSDIPSPIQPGVTIKGGNP